MVFNEMESSVVHHTLLFIFGAKEQQEAHQLVGKAKRSATKIRPKAGSSSILGRFSNFDNCQLEPAGDNISGFAID